MIYVSGSKSSHLQEMSICYTSENTEIRVNITGRLSQDYFNDILMPLIAKSVGAKVLNLRLS